jgi:outer membrane receptor protein involved in Fe transport
MFQKLLMTVAVVLASTMLVFSQAGSLKGKVTNKENNEPIPFANIVVESGGHMVTGGTTDFAGEYHIRPINPGTYDLTISYVGFEPQKIKGIVIKSGQVVFFNLQMKPTQTVMTTFVVSDYAVPLIDADQTQSGATLTSEEIKKMPGRSAASVAATVGGVFTDENGNIGGIRGQRSSGTVTYVDGVRVRGSSGVPQAAIDQVTVITGGLPAMYGDATGGIINITTKGPSRQFGAGIELVTSQLTDRYGYNLLGFNLQGPILTRTENNVSRSVIGYFISGEVNYVKDDAPAAGGTWTVDPDKLTMLQEHPLRPSGTGFGSFANSMYIQQSDMINLKSNQYNSSMGASFSGKIDVRLSKTANFSVGTRWNYNDADAWSSRSAMFNPNTRGHSTFSEYSFFGRYTQRFESAQNSGALIKNLYYTINANYTRTVAKSEHRDHKDDIFKYGYVGKFDTYTTNSYELGDDTIAGFKNVYIHNGFRDTLYTFEYSDINPLLSNYTQQYYNLYDLYSGLYANSTFVQAGQALLNGDAPSSVYGLYPNTGTPYGTYSKVYNTQFAINAHASADIGNHSLKFGLQYEQRIDRSYGLAPIGLWTAMRQYANFHIKELDKNNPHPVYDANGVFQDTINYDRLLDLNSQFLFDYNLRKELGLPLDGLDWIDVDNIDPARFSVDMFSADELLRSGNNALVSYYGFDHKGQVLDYKPSLDDFFTEKVDGRFTRPIAAFEPIYMAGYIEDKFAFRDLIFNIGIRVDRYDANQKVLSDPYLLYQAKTVQEVADIDGSSVAHPSTMGDDYVVYVNDIKNPSAIVGYRNGSTWYNAQGTEILDPKVLETATGIAPYLVNPDQEVVNSSAFKDYAPQTSILPRVSFSFPISDAALFFAHYDVLTKRPTYGNRMNPIEYLFINNFGSSSINNPNLLPEKTVDYELGFQQKLNDRSSIKLSAFYREMRDLVQAYRFSGAYPVPYYSYNNIDFGTVKGYTVMYDLRRSSNVWVKASYTMQFADGTGSNEESASALIRSGQPNLRTTNPLSFDRRHAISTVVDYRFDSGKRYNGPVITRKLSDGTEKSIKLLESTGVNFTFRGGSGVPYSKSSTVYASLLTGGAILQGSLNGSRLPWQFAIDARIDRDINLSFGKDEGKKDVYMNVYVQVLNVLNTKNVMGVYRATGNPDDDGYLSAAEYQTQINDQNDPQAYRDLYYIAVNNPYNYSLPRRIRVGVMLNF